MKKTVIISMVLLIGFLGCKIHTPFYLNIDNQTNDTIKVVFLGKSPYTVINPDSLFFPPKHKKLLYGAEELATNSGCNYTGIKEKEIEVYTFSGKKLRKDIWDVNNWNCSGSYKHGWEMNFIITENDLE